MAVDLLAGLRLFWVPYTYTIITRSKWLWTCLRGVQVIHLSNPFLDGNQSSVDGSDLFGKASIGHRTSGKEGTGQKMRNRDKSSTKRRFRLANYLHPFPGGAGNTERMAPNCAGG